ncbi:MAG: hypothetical protein GXO11_02505, partial [Epsilonproteobacteria bacterium]|nr:hypothetical protein [Campylobacterota bacterium]
MKRFTFLFFLFINSIYAKSYTLIEAITTALTNNQRHTISIQDIQIAKAKYKQALSANYPTLDISFMMNRRDEAFVDEVKTDFSLPPILGGSTLPINYTHIVTGRDTAKATIQTQY